MNEAQKKADWIAAQIAEGRTVYLRTHLKATKITKKTADAISVRGSNLYVGYGKNAVCADYCQISAN